MHTHMTLAEFGAVQDIMCEVRNQMNEHHSLLNDAGDVKAV